MIQYYKNEYEENISKINLFYDKFGFYLGKKSDDNIKAIKVFQPMSFTNLYQQINSLIANSNSTDVKKKRKSINVENIKQNKNKDKKEDDKINNIAPSELYQIFTQTINDFFTLKIETLYEIINI